MKKTLRFALSGFPLAMILAPVGLRSGLMLGIWLAFTGLVMAPAAQEQWTQQGSTIPGDATGDEAGYSVSLSSDGLTLAMAAPYNSSNRGQVKVFKLVGGVWTLQGSPITGDADGDYAGLSVSLSSDGLTLAVGAPYNSGNQGQVKVYKLVSGVWTLQGNPIAGDATGDYAGLSVSLSSDGLTLALGASGNSSNQGQVKVFKLVSGVWILQGSPIAGDATGDHAGNSVSLSSDGLTLALGAISNSSNRGQVKVYKLVGGVWTLQGSPIAGDATGNYAGWSVSLSSDGLTLALGAPNYSTLLGQVKVYKLVSGVWTLQGSPITGEATNDRAGYSVSLSTDGLTLALGAYGNSSGRGQVKVFKLVGGTWSLQGSPIIGGAIVDEAGWSVSLSSDGLTVALGAPFNGSGQVMVYRFCNLSVSITPSSPSICPGTSLTLTASAGADSYSWSNGQTSTTITVSPTSLTPYSVTATTGVCSATATTTVTILAPVVASLSPSSSTLTCASTSLTLTASEGTSYNFSGPGLVSQNPASGTAVVNAAGLYSVTVTSSGGCSATATTTVSGNTTPPSVSINPSSYTLTNASPSVSLTAVGTGSLVWSTGATTQVISVTASGIYSVTLTSPNGCTASASVAVIGSDLTVNLELPQANFAASGTAAVGNFLVNVFEVAGLPTLAGNVTITVTAPVGYTLAFVPTLTSINVSGGEHNPVVVTNPQWTVTQSVANRQLTLTMNTGAFIGGGGESSLGFSITRTTANSGSSANVTVNVADDPTRGYDGNLTNNVYARVISGL